MSLTKDQIKARRNYLGASEIPAVLGVDPHRSPIDVYLSKTESLDDITSPAMEAGNLLEPVLIQYAEQRVGRPCIERGVMHTLGNLCATLDGRFSDAEIIEAKTTGIVDGWGDEETDAIPDRVLVQVHQQFVVTGAVIAWVPVILARFGLQFRMYRVDRNDDLCGLVSERGEAFMADVQRGRPPVGIPSLEVLKRIRREPGTWVDVPDDLVAAWLDAKEAAKAADSAKEQAQAALLLAFGGADGAHSGLGDLTYMETERKAYQVAATRYRTLRLKVRK